MKSRAVLFWSSMIALASPTAACHLADEDLQERVAEAFEGAPKPAPGPRPSRPSFDAGAGPCEVMQVPPPPMGVDVGACPAVGSACDTTLPTWCFVPDGRLAVYRCNVAPDGTSFWDPIAVAGDLRCEGRPGPAIDTGGRDAGARDGGAPDGGRKLDGGPAPSPVHPACLFGRLPPAAPHTEVCPPLGQPCTPVPAKYGTFCRLTSGPSAIFACALAPDRPGYGWDVQALEGARCHQP